MSLANLLKIKQLQLHSPSNEALLRLLDAAKRNIADAHIEAVSGENRFDAATHWAQFRHAFFPQENKSLHQ